MSYPPPVNQGYSPDIQGTPGYLFQSNNSNNHEHTGIYPPHKRDAWQPGEDSYQWDDLPDRPLPDNRNAEPSPYQPPCMTGFQQYKGYETCGEFGQFSPMAPPPPPPPPSGQAPSMEFDSVANLSERDCRQAMLEFVGKHCCYGKKPAKHMTITLIKPTTALHYILETYSESRSTGYEHEPYWGGDIEGPENGIPPAPWDIYCPPDHMFVAQIKKLEVPHTSVVKHCNHCRARGFLRCHGCHGLGWVRCLSCGGDGQVMRVNSEGRQERHHCHSCGGDGKTHCHTCSGDGRVRCTTCRGHRYIRCFIALTVKFTTHKNDYIMEKTDMPDELVRDVEGTVVFQQVLPQVWPIVSYPVQDINVNSQRLVDKHYRSYTDERKLNQRHQLRAVPVTEVAYIWNNVNKRYWVYGREREVHAPDYPQQCCWGCHIM